MLGSSHTLLWPTYLLLSFLINKVSPTISVSEEVIIMNSCRSIHDTSYRNIPSLVQVTELIIYSEYVVQLVLINIRSRSVFII